MNSNIRVFLDTSIQIERLVGSIENRALIERQISSAEFYAVTSHYVLMEFQRSVIADSVRVYNQILHFETWHETALALRSGAMAQRPRALGRCMQVLTEIMVQSQLDRNNALRLLRIEIQRNLLRRFWHNVTVIDDPIVCDLVALGITAQPNARFTVADSCRKQTAACHLPDFLREQRHRISALIAYLSTHPQSIKDQARVEQKLRTVLDNPRTALGQTACWPLGDVIIALQIPAGRACGRVIQTLCR